MLFSKIIKFLIKKTLKIRFFRNYIKKITTYISEIEKINPSNNDQIINKKISELKPKKPSARNNNYLENFNLGIAVYGFSKPVHLNLLLKSLEIQNVLKYTNIFIDGTQGAPESEPIKETKKIAKKYNVKNLFINNGNFGFRKQMITSMKYMSKNYSNVIFLEDDCIPSMDAVYYFVKSLKKIENKKNIFSVYGSPFFQKNESFGKTFARFQSWGWATNSNNLKFFIPKLNDIYQLNEKDYFEQKSILLTSNLKKKIDITPGRQPSTTINKFFSWDETLTMITAYYNFSHLLTDKRVIYNCGAVNTSLHFKQLWEFLKKPPYNMVDIESCIEKIQE
jgi:hypothetical protein